MNKLHLDFETRSELDIKKVGAFKYAMHPSTEIMCMAWSYNREQTPYVLLASDIKKGWTIPVEYIEGFRLSAHSAHFEYAIWNYILHRRHGWPALWEPSRWACTLARAAMCNLPLSLEGAGEALKITMQKDLNGRAAMLKLCKPIAYDPIQGKSIYNEDPDLYQILYKYCQRDVIAEMQLDEGLPEMPDSERAIWELDLIINHRGVHTDVALAKSAAALGGPMIDELNRRLNVMTNGALSKASRVEEIKKYLRNRGITVKSLDKPHLNAFLSDPNIPEHVKNVLRIRRQVGKKTSIAKYPATILAASPVDDRVRGALQYHAAGTGRWGGRLIQPHNFPKGLGEHDQAQAIELIMAGDAEMFSLVYGDKSMETLSDTLRGVIDAGPGKQLVVADFAAIEARVLFWLAGAENALQRYRDGFSPYIDLAEFIYGEKNITKKGHPQKYELGKRGVLGAGFGMGPPKFQETCLTQAHPPLVISLDLAKKSIRSYREKYREVPDLWKEVELAAKSAIQYPGSVAWCAGRRVSWGMSDDRRFLICKLPSGRFLRYYKPSLKYAMTPWGEKLIQVHFWGEDPDTKQWVEMHTYGGSLVENITQAVARDLMAHGMLNCESAGYPIVLTVHDELVSEVAMTEGRSLEKFIKIMCDIPGWAPGCPVTAEGWVGQRYRK